MSLIPSLYSGDPLHSESSLYSECTIVKHVNSNVKITNTQNNNKKNVVRFSNPTELRKIIRELPNNSRFYFIPENVDDASIKSPKRKNLFYINQDSIIKKEYYEKNPSGMFYIIRIVCLYAFFMRNDDNVMMTDIQELWDCDDGYSEFFSGYGINYCESSNNSSDINEILILTKLNIPYLFENLLNNIYNIPVELNHLFRLFVNLNWETFSNNRKLVSKFFAISPNWFYPNKKITQNIDDFFESYDTTSIFIAIHARSMCHFKTESKKSKKFYECFIEELEHIILNVKNNPKCLIFGDNKISIKNVKDLLSQKILTDINYRDVEILDYNNTDSRDDLCEINVDWCQQNVCFNKFYGSVHDAYFMSKCDYIIGGRSNLTMYSVSLSDKCELIIPKMLQVDTY